MRDILTFASGFVVALAGVYWMESYVWTRSLASFTCGLEDRVTVFGSIEDGGWCVDMRDAYPSDAALARLIARISE